MSSSLEKVETDGRAESCGKTSTELPENTGGSSVAGVTNDTEGRVVDRSQRSRTPSPESRHGNGNHQTGHSTESSFEDLGQEEADV